MSIHELNHIRELYRFAELGRMSASLLHEISNPLSAALINLEVSEQMDPSVRKARKNMQLLRRYVEAARQQVRGHSARTSFLFKPQLDQIKQLMEPIANKAGVKVKFDTGPEQFRLFGDPVKLQQVITILIKNSIQAYDRTEVKSPLVLIKYEYADKQLSIKVLDWGEGIKPSDISKVFNMFYTTKAVGGHGLGIGLALAKQIITNDFGGSIKATSTVAKGTCFAIKLPAQSMEL